MTIIFFYRLFKLPDIPRQSRFSSLTGSCVMTLWHLVIWHTRANEVSYYWFGLCRYFQFDLKINFGLLLRFFPETFMLPKILLTIIVYIKKKKKHLKDSSFWIGFNSPIAKTETSAIHTWNQKECTNMPRAKENREPLSAAVNLPVEEVYVYF